MALTPSTMLPLGTQAPGFRLPDTSGRLVAVDDFAGAPALLVAFLCNHCPYVKHVQAGFATFATEYAPRGLAIVAINSNDFAAYPEDAPERMAEEAERHGYTFPYLVDEARRSRRPTAPRVRRTSSSSMRPGGSSIAGNSTRAARAIAPRSRGATCGLPPTPSWRGAPCPRRRRPASAATSSGCRAASPTTPDSGAWRQRSRRTRAVSFAARAVPFARSRGEVAERSKAAVLKTARAQASRGFESLPLRHPAAAAAPLAASRCARRTGSTPSLALLAIGAAAAAGACPRGAVSQECSC